MSFETELKKLIIEAVAEGVRQGFSQLTLPLAPSASIAPEAVEETTKTKAKKVKVEPTIKVTVETAEPTIKVVEAEKVEPKVEVKPTAPVAKAEPKAEPKVSAEDAKLEFQKYRESVIGVVKDFKYNESIHKTPTEKQAEANRIIAKVLDKVQPGAKANVEILPENRKAVIELLTAYKDKGESIFADDSSDDGII